MNQIYKSRPDFFFFFMMLIKMMIYENNLNSCCVPTFLLHDFVLSYLALRQKKEKEKGLATFYIDIY